MHSKMMYDGDRQLSITAAAAGKRRASGMRTYSKHTNSHQDRSSSKRQRIKEPLERDSAPSTARSSSSLLPDRKPLDSNTAEPHLHHTRRTNDRPSTTSRLIKEHLDGSSNGPGALSPQQLVNANRACDFISVEPYSLQTARVGNRSSTEEPIDNDYPDLATSLSQQPVKTKRVRDPDFAEPHSSHAKRAKKRDWDTRIPLEELPGNIYLDKVLRPLPRLLKTKTDLYFKTTGPQTSRNQHTTEPSRNQRRSTEEPSRSSLPASATEISLQRLRKGRRDLEHSTTKTLPSQVRREKEATNKKPSPAEAPRSSIQNYFKPIQRSSSPPPSQAALQSSDPIDSSTNTLPPSGPPLQLQVTPVPRAKRSKGRLPRRLTTRSSLTKSATMDCNDGVTTGHESIHVSTDLKTEECCVRGGISNLVNEWNGTHCDGEPLTQLPDLPSVESLPSCLPPASPQPTNGSFTSGESVFPSGSVKPIDIPPAKAQKKSLKPGAPCYQAQLDLGQSYQKVCPKCQMPYNSALLTDRDLHDKRCYTKNDLPRLANEESEFNHNFVSIRNIHGINHKTMVVTCTSDSHLKNLALKILDFTYKEMGGMVYSPKELWEVIKEPRDPKGRHEACRYKVYIRYINRAVAGLLVSERFVDKMVVQTDGIPPGEKFVVIDRIWVSNERRWQGVASEMVDDMRKDFIPGMRLDKKHLTTSQLTDSHGKGWAQKYFAECWPQHPLLKSA